MAVVVISMPKSALQQCGDGEYSESGRCEDGAGREQKVSPDLFTVQKQDTPGLGSRWLRGMGRGGIPILPVTDMMAGRDSHLPPLLLYHFSMELSRVEMNNKETKEQRGQGAGTGAIPASRATQVTDANRTAICYVPGAT